MDLVEMIVTGAGLSIALITLVIGVLEYRKKTMLERIQLYLKMRDYYARDENLKNVCSALGGGENEISSLTYQERRQFLGTIESIALMVNSKVMNDYVAMYMFGYYAITAWESDAFWDLGDLDREHPMWVLFNDFARKSKHLRADFEKKPAFLAKQKLHFLPNNFSRYS